MPKSFEVTYHRTFTKVINADNIYDAINIAESNRPDGFITADVSQIKSREQYQEVKRTIANQQTILS